MTTVDEISKQARQLPERYQKEVLHYIQFLMVSAQNSDSDIEDSEWSTFSLAQALRGMENEDVPEYGEADLKERWL